jgi:Uma2 family endonuclease
MATALTLPLMTVEQYFELPDPDGPYIWELHFGEPVKVGRPKRAHYNMQMLLLDLLTRKLSIRKWLVGVEMPYGLTPGYDYRGADVGVVLRKRWDADPEADAMIGSPDIVIQVKSRSNRDRKMEEDALLHITHGASAVWLVKLERREVIVITAASRQVYALGQSIPLPGSASVDVSEIFVGDK